MNTKQLAKLMEDERNLRLKLDKIRRKLKEIVETDGCDAGVIYLSTDSPTHKEIFEGYECIVYDHQYFSPLGDALMELWELAKE